MNQSTSHINIKIALVIDYIDFKLIFQNNSKNRRNYFFIKNSKNGYYFKKYTSVVLEVMLDVESSGICSSIWWWYRISYLLKLKHHNFSNDLDCIHSGVNLRRYRLLLLIDSSNLIDW